MYLNNQEEVGEKAKKRGRPRGSKNKPKDDPPNKRQNVAPKSAFEKALEGAVFEQEDISEDSAMVDCCTCNFSLNGEEEEEKCPGCGVKIHCTCLKGTDGCQNCELINV